MGEESGHLVMVMMMKRGFYYDDNVVGVPNPLALPRASEAGNLSNGDDEHDSDENDADVSDDDEVEDYYYQLCGC